MLVVLVTDVSFVDFNAKPVVIKADTTVYLDRTENVAFYNGYHFDIYAEEFKILQ